MGGTFARVRWILGLTIGMWLVAAFPAFAYIDPGSTSMVFQALIAFAMAAGLTMKMFWRRIRSFFGRAPEETADGTSEEFVHDDAV